MMEHIEIIADDTRVFLCDVHDHFVYIKDTIISFRELADGIQDGYMSIISCCYDSSAAAGMMSYICCFIVYGLLI